MNKDYWANEGTKAMVIGVSVGWSALVAMMYLIHIGAI